MIKDNIVIKTKSNTYLFTEIFAWKYMHGNYNKFKKTDECEGELQGNNPVCLASLY